MRLAASLVVACELLVAACLWDLVPWPGIEPGPPALGARSLNHCAIREVAEIIEFRKITLLQHVGGNKNENQRSSKGVAAI